MTLFDTYQDREEVKPIFRIGDLGLVKYRQKQLPIMTEDDIWKHNTENREWVEIGGKLINRPKEKKKRGITNQRQSIIKEFVDEINAERKDTKYKPVTGRGIAIKLSVFKTNEELYEFLSICRDFKKRHGSFSKRFFGGFKKQEWKT